MSTHGDSDEERLVSVNKWLWLILCLVASFVGPQRDGFLRLLLDTNAVPCLLTRPAFIAG